MDLLVLFFMKLNNFYFKTGSQTGRNKIKLGNHGFLLSNISANMLNASIKWQKVHNRLTLMYNLDFFLLRWSIFETHIKAQTIHMMRRGGGLVYCIHTVHCVQYTEYSRAKLTVSFSKLAKWINCITLCRTGQFIYCIHTEVLRISYPANSPHLEIPKEGKLSVSFPKKYFTKY